MPLDGSCADVQLRGDLRIGSAVARQPRNVLFLFGERGAALVTSLAEVLARRDELSARALGEAIGSHHYEHVVRGAQLLASLVAPLLALQLLAERTPEIILLDIEMPRMDGFEFAKTIKADSRLARIPIIMITSRTAAKHRNRAASLGIELFVGKPYQEEELLRQLRELVAVQAA